MKLTLHNTNGINLNVLPYEGLRHQLNDHFSGLIYSAIYSVICDACYRALRATPFERRP
jgi:hypothetical protein